MPSGAIHDRIAVVASPLLAIGATAAQLALGRAPLEALLGGMLLTASHLACSNWLSPDLDLGSATIDERWGVLFPIWWPYERLIPHRHWLSHSGVSALLRLLYLFVALNVVLLLVGALILLQGAVIGLFVANLPGSASVWAWLLARYIAVVSAGLELVRVYPVETLALAGGALIADLLHTGADLIDTQRKRRRLRMPALPLLYARHRRQRLRMPTLPLLGPPRRRPARRTRPGARTK